MGQLIKPTDGSSYRGIVTLVTDDTVYHRPYPSQHRDVVYEKDIRNFYIKYEPI